MSELLTDAEIPEKHSVSKMPTSANGDRIAALKTEYERTGTDRSNLAYGWC